MEQAIIAPRKPARLRAPVYPYTERQSYEAWANWGCNCGPSALATMLSLKPDDVRPHLNYFDERRYMSPTMMKDALDSLGVKFTARATPKMDPSQCKLFTNYGLCRIQWEGPWTKPGANPKWAYRQTHWIGAMKWREEDFLFDVNSGWSDQSYWERETVPKIVQNTPRATGGWFVTHRWDLDL